MLLQTHIRTYTYIHTLLQIYIYPNQYHYSNTLNRPKLPKNYINLNAEPKHVFEKPETILDSTK